MLPMQETLTTLTEAIAPITDGAVVALQNMATQAAPMALVRELIRQEKRDLGLVVLVGGMAVDWLAGAGVINRLIGAAVGMTILRVSFQSGISACPRRRSGSVRRTGRNAGRRPRP